MAVAGKSGQNSSAQKAGLNLFLQDFLASLCCCVLKKDKVKEDMSKKCQQKLVTSKKFEKEF